MTVDKFRLFGVAAFYHFTDRRHLPSIIEHGGIYCRRELQKRGIKVVAPGGNDWSQDADIKTGMDRYVHVCLVDNHPMEYLAVKEGRIGPTIFLQLNASVRDMDGVMFSKGVANKSGVSIMPLSQAIEENAIDFEVLYSRTDWKDPVIKLRRKDALKCEILVPNMIPLSYIQNLR